MSRLPGLARHGAVGLLFFALAVAWTWPLATHLSTHIPGGAGDNLAFLWNAWWMRTALASHLDPFHTDRLFAPIGIDLTLHTHAALTSWAGATIFRRLPLITAHNLTIISSLALNGIAAYLLAWDRVRDRGAAVLAGLIFFGSPYLAAHLAGHVNLLSAWGVPLGALFVLRALERRSWGYSAFAGAVLALIAYCDYYYVVYSVTLTLALYAFEVARVEWRRAALPHGLRTAIAALLSVDLLLICVVVVSGGFTKEILGVRIVATRPTNLLVAAWVLLAVFLLWQFRPRLRAIVSWQQAVDLFCRAVLPMAAVAVMGVSPLLRRALTLVRAGDYTAPASSWRSGPGGVDLATLFIGNPWHGWLGGGIRALYEQLHINPIEGVGWVGIVPLLLAAVAIRSHGGALDREVRIWRWTGALFAVWALGPWLRIAGIDSGLLLPQNLLAHVPLVSNARMPGRAMVVVFVAVALLAALTIARTSGRRRQWLLPAAIALTLVDYWPAPYPLTRIETPRLYETLRSLPAGTVCELPLGARDGFGSVGQFDDWQLIYQTVHAHPIVGGFAARVPASIDAAYRVMPVLRSLWSASEGKATAPEDEALNRTETAAALRGATVSYLVLNRDLASAALINYVERSIPVRLLMKEGTKELYAITFPGEVP